jgi:hypothetical protein
LPADGSFNLSQPIHSGQTIYPYWNKLGSAKIGGFPKHGEFRAPAPQAEISLQRKQYLPRMEDL